MNYGYPPGDRDEELAERLTEELDIKRGWSPRAKIPYIEVDGLYPGVRIRRITHLSEKMSELLDLADKIYLEVYPEREKMSKDKKEMMEIYDELKDADPFVEELAILINKYSKGNGSDTPDFVLAKYLANCLYEFDRAVERRELFYDRKKLNETQR